MIALTENEQIIKSKYEENKGGRYPNHNNVKGYDGEGGKKKVMIISFCPNMKKDITAQLERHYDYLKEAGLSDAHLTDFIKVRMSPEDATKYYKAYYDKPNDKMKNEMKSYTNIIKWEIDHYTPKIILLMGRKAESLFKSLVKDFVKKEKLSIKTIKIPHFTMLSYEKCIKEYHEILSQIKGHF